jgi:HSP20 family protein
MATALVRRDRFDFPEMWRRMFEPEGMGSWMRVEEYSDDGALVVRAELPGIDPDHDVELTISDGVLHIRAERHERTEKKEKGSYRSEFRYGSLERNVALPTGAKDEDVTATYADGILEVRVPYGQAKPSTTTVPVKRA